MTEQINNTAHLVIDFQAFYSGQIHKGSARALGRKIGVLREKLKEQGIPTIWIVFEPNEFYRQKMIILPNTPKADSLGTDVGYLKQDVWRIPTDEAHSLYTFTDVKPTEDEIVFSKVNDDAFANIMLDEYLKKTGIKNLVFSGLYSSMCITKTLVSGLKLGYDCTALTDLVNDFDFPAPRFSQMGVMAHAVHQEVTARLVRKDTGKHYTDTWRFLADHLHLVESDDYLGIARPKKRKPRKKTALVATPK